MAEKISREAEAQIPAFKDAREAIAWFKEKYASDFILQDTEPIGGELCHFYALVHDWEAYMKGRKQLQMQGGHAVGLEFLLSYQPIQIMADGSVHIVH